MAYIPPLNGGRLNASIGGNSTSAGAGYSYMSTGNMVLMGGNNITLSQNGNSVSIIGGAGGASINFSAGTTSGNLASVTFANSNGVGFGLNAGTITASHNGITVQSNQSLGLYALGNTTQSSSGTADARSLSFNGLGAATMGYSNGSIQVSAPATSSLAVTGALSLSVNGSTVSIGAPAFSAGMSNIGNTVGTSGTVSNQVIFAGGNNITLSQSTGAGGNTISISAGNGGSPNFSAGTTSNSLGSVVFSNGNGVSFGLNGSTITGSIATSLTNINLSAGTTSNNLSAMVFSNANGVSFGLNGSTVTGSHNGITSQSNPALAGSNGSFTFQTATLGNLNGLSFYSSNGSMVGSYTVPTQSNQSISLVASGANSFGTAGSNLDARSVSLSGMGAVSLGFSTDGIFRISAPTQTIQTANLMTVNGTQGAVSISGGANVTVGNNASTITISAAAQTNQTLGINVTGNTIQSNTGTVDARNLTFNGMGNVSVGYSNGSVQISGSGGGGGVSIAASNTTFSSGAVVMSNNGGALTISTGAQSVLFSVPATSSLSATGGVSLSTNGSVISIGVPMATLSRWEYPLEVFTSLGSVPQGSLSLQHMYVPFNISGAAAKIGGSLAVGTGTSATTGGASISLWMGIYTLSGSTLSLATSGSANNSFLVNNTGATGNNSSITGLRQLTVPMTVNMTPGEYWMAAAMSTATNFGSNAISFTLYGNTLPSIGSGVSAPLLAPIGSGTGAARDAFLFQGIYTAATSAGPTTIVSNQILNTASSAVQRAAFYHAIYNATY